MNKRLILLIGMSVIFIVAVALAFMDTPLTGFVKLSLLPVQTVGLMEMFQNGTFKSTRYFKIAVALMGVFLIAVVMIIMQISAAEDIALFVFSGILITYFFHFLGKKPKTVLDILKLVTLVFFFPAPLWFFRPISSNTKDVVLLLGHMIFGITFVLYLFMQERKKLVSK